MPKDAATRRKSSADFHAKRKADGWVKATVWLKPESVFRIDAFKAALGSQDGVVNAALAAYQGPAADPITGNEQALPDQKARAAKLAKVQRAANVQFRDDVEKEVVRRMVKAPYGSRLKKPKGAKP